MSIVSERRMGRFSIDTFSLLRGPRKDIEALMSRVVVVRCEAFPHIDGYEYLAYSDMFDSTEMGESVPEYRIVVTDNDGDISVAAVKI